MCGPQKRIENVYKTYIKYFEVTSTLIGFLYISYNLHKLRPYDRITEAWKLSEIFIMRDERTYFCQVRVF